MTIKYLLIVSSLLIHGLISAQEHQPSIVTDSSISMLELFWKVSEDNVQTHHTDGQFFYRTFVLRTSESEATVEGESMDRLYVLKGEYGEYPAGLLYDLGTYYNVISVSIADLDSKPVVEIVYGSEQKPERIDVRLTSE